MARRGFTLIELLIVITVLAVMMVVVIPSFGMIGATQQALATKDTLRLMRYARNMALQTQVPVTLTFSPERVVIASAFDEGQTSTDATQEEEAAETSTPIRAAAAEEEEDPKGDRNRLETESLETVGFTKHYENVAFEFLGYDDSISRKTSSADRAMDFHRRGIDTSDDASFTSAKDPSETFTITVRANGTTRPFSMRVYPKDTDSEGAEITFDFLCSGQISE